MKRVRTDKLLKRRAKLILDYFFNVKGKLLAIFSVTLIVLLAFSVLTCSQNFAVLANETIHYILGSLAIFNLLLILLTVLKVFSSKIDYEELEQIFETDRKVAKEELFKVMALKNDRKDYINDPIEIICPENYPGRNTIVYRYEPAIKKVFYSQTGYLWLLFGAKTFYYYHVSINHVYGMVGFESGVEVNYKDIVSVKTETKRSNKVESLVMSLGLINGETLEIVIRNAPSKLDDGSTKRLSESEEKIVKLLREIIRNNK